MVVIPTLSRYAIAMASKRMAEVAYLLGISMPRCLYAKVRCHRWAAVELLGSGGKLWWHLKMKAVIDVELGRATDRSRSARREMK